MCDIRLWTERNGQWFVIPCSASHAATEEPHAFLTENREGPFAHITPQPGAEVIEQPDLFRAARRGEVKVTEASEVGLR